MHRHLPAPNCGAANTSHHSLGLTHLHRVIQCILLFCFHFPMHANILLLGAFPRWTRKMYPVKCCRRFVLWVLGTELRHRLGVQYCPNFHCARSANEQEEEVYCSNRSRLLCYVSRTELAGFRRVLTSQQWLHGNYRPYPVHPRTQRR
jgi:hypothetical protein